MLTSVMWLSWMTDIVSKRKLPANRKEYLRLLEQARKERSRKLIGLYLVHTADWLLRLPQVHRLRYDTRTGVITFHYLGASLQYSVGSEKLYIQHGRKRVSLEPVHAMRLVTAVIQCISVDALITRLEQHPLKEHTDG